MFQPCWCCFWTQVSPQTTDIEWFNYFTYTSKCNTNWYFWSYEFPILAELYQIKLFSIPVDKICVSILRQRIFFECIYGCNQKRGHLIKLHPIQMHWGTCTCLEVLLQIVVNRWTRTFLSSTAIDKRCILHTFSLNPRGRTMSCVDSPTNHMWPL